MEKEELEFSSLSAYVSSFKDIIDEEYDYIKKVNWLDAEKETKIKAYKFEEGVVSTTCDYLRGMQAYQKDSTELYKRYYDKLLKFFTLHKKRVQEFTNKSHEELDIPIESFFSARREMAKNLAKMQIIVNKAKTLEENTTVIKTPRIKNDSPISVPHWDVISRSFTGLHDMVVKDMQAFIKKSKVKLSDNMKEWLNKKGYNLK